jgi:hypothetical protein
MKDIYPRYVYGRKEISDFVTWEAWPLQKKSTFTAQPSYAYILVILQTGFCVQNWYKRFT